MANQTLSSAQTARLTTLSTVMPDEDLKNKLSAAFTANKGNWTATVEALKKENVPGPDLQKLDLLHSLSDITNDNAKVVATIAAIPNITSLRDFALTHDVKAIANLIPADAIPPAPTPASPPASTTSGGLGSPPASTDLTSPPASSGAPAGAAHTLAPADASASADAQKMKYANDIHNKLFAVETSAVLQRMTANSELPITDANVRAGVTNFLANQPNFNIRTDSLYKAVQQPSAFKGIDDQNREPVVTQLKTLQRLQAVSTAPSTVGTLMSAGISSAHQIAEKTPTSFLAAHTAQLGETEAKAVYYHATNIKVRNELTLQNFSDAVQGTGIAAIDGNLTRENRVAQFDEIAAAQQVNLSWSTLFGNIDYCQCSDCNSVYSPASYYVELLQYLRNNDLDPSQSGGQPVYPNTGKAGIAGTVLEKFFARRPDLGCLELSCANTNTIIPYIDLVNEVMESFVVHLDKFKVTEAAGEIDVTDIIDVWNTADETTNELLAQPQHTNYKAYCILKSAVYPFTLPYHQPIDEIRIFLKFLGTSRYDLLKTFRTGAIDDSTGAPEPLLPAPASPPASPPLSGPNEAMLISLNNAALQRAIDAEYLGLTQEEYIILTKEAFWQKQFFDIKGNTTLTTAAYQKNIGVKNVWDYYGYPTEADMLNTDTTAETGLMFVKSQFLNRTGIQYTDLINLLLTKYINPGYPSGKALTILDSIRFSYRYLQGMVDNSSTDPKTKYAKLISFLETAQPLVPALDALLHPDPCHANDPDSTVDPKVFEKWVMCHFEKVGKLIILESGDGPYFPIEGKLYPLRQGVYDNDQPKDVLNNAKPIGTLHTTGNVVDSSGNIIGQVNAQSVIVFTGAAAQYNTATLTIMDGPITIAYSTANGVFRYGAASVGNAAGVPTAPTTGQITWWPPQDTCNIDNVQLQHLDGTSLTSAEYDKFQRFIRLWQKLGWTIDETDKALTGLGIYKTGSTSSGSSSSAANDANLFTGFTDNCDCDPNDTMDCGCGCSDPTTQGYYYDIAPDFIHQLVAVKKLQDNTGLELIKLLTFWTTISTLGNPSLYQRLFLTHNMVGIDPIFEADSNGNYLTTAGKITDHIPVIMAAFNLKATDISTIMTFANIPDSLTIQNVSMIYRNSLLMRVLQVKSFELQQVETLFGNPFTNADTSWHFVEIWGKMNDAGFTFRQLNYIFNGSDDPTKPLTPLKKTMLILAKTLYDGLNQIDAANADLTPDELATLTSDFVQTKAALLYNSDVTAQIMDLLNGTTVYTTNAPVNLVTQQSDFTAKLTGTLVGKLKYDFVGGSVQVTGILSPTEIIAAKAIFNNADWASAFDRIAKQPMPFYNDVLAGIFPTPPPGQPDPSQAMLLQGDSNIPDAQQDPSNPIPDTAPLKLAYFITAFLPFLRNRLENKFIIDTISDQSGMDEDVTETMITEILLDGSPVSPIIETFRGIKNQPAVSSPWTGFLVPSAEDTYTFIFTVNTGPLTASLQINGQNINFTQQADPNNVWLSDPVKLKSGNAYPIIITGISADLHELGWKTSITARTPIPASVLYPDDSTATVTEAYIRVQKAAILVTGFSLTANEVTYLQQHGTDFDNLDFNAIQLIHWKHLNGYTRLRNSLPNTTNLDLIGFFTWVDQATDSSQLSAQIAALTLWDQSDIDKLIAPAHFNLGLADFKNEKKLLKLQHAIYVAGQISMDINLLFNWAEPTSKFWTCQAIAQNIRITTKARYTEDDWEQVVPTLNNQLRQDQRDALVAYLLVQPELIKWGVQDADSLFEFFLIDVQMDACMQTSRIKQAINSVQLFVQRVFLGLEEPYGLANDRLDRDRWEWMQREVLWVANRKVFLYPENWIDENLRDDKTDFFTELQSELLQKDINTDNVETALKNYLYKLDAVADMRVVGLFVDDTKSLVHVFSRTKNAPYFFYYRYFDGTQKTWSAWSEIKVDVQGYDVEDLSTGKITDNGCYLIPVVWDNRLLIFFPQITKKTAPPPNNSNVSASYSSGSSGSATAKTPAVLWDIKMAWSELRNGVWTQKQVSKDSLYDPDYAPINKFSFVPNIDSNAGITIMIINGNGTKINDGSNNTFNFTGNNIILAPLVAIGSATLPSNFHYSGGTIYPLQRYTTQSNSDVSSTEFVANSPSIDLSTNSNYAYFEFFHPYTHQLLSAVETGDLIDFFECAPNLPVSADRISTLPAGNVSDYDYMFGQLSVSGGSIYDELAAPYSLYNWELFFHIPAMLGGSLSTAQNFEEAMAWYQYIFNPTAKGDDVQRFWRFWPFQQSNAQNYLETLFNSLQPNTPDDVDGQINQWRDNPFQPHVIARKRPSAYMKWIVMQYLDNIIAWGDYLFTQQTIESINQATQLYILASHILGKRPEVIPQRGNIKVETYNSLLNKWDAFGNAMVELELVFPYSNQVNVPIEKYNDTSVGFANIYGFSTTLYFCIPDNPTLTGYWDIIADRLYKIRNCENIEGIFSLPPLWDPPIDPGLLVNAVAQGISISSILNDLSTPLPNYRFNYLIQKSLELCGELKAMGNSLLSIFEKKDAEALASMRARHENNINNLIMQVKTQQLDEANKNLDGLQQNRLGPVYRLQHYLALIGNTMAVPDENTDFAQIADQIETPIDDSGLKLISLEKEEMDRASDAHDYQKAVGILETLAGILHLIPHFSVDAKPIGVGAGFAFGGMELGVALEAAAKGVQVHSNDLSFQSSAAGRKAGFTRQLQDRVLAANNAGYEIKQIDKQIASQQVRIQIANQEITNQQQQIDNSAEVLDFLTNKYTNEDLYTWMRDSVKSLYYQVYTLAYGLAKKAEMVYRYDRGLTSSNFIQFGYWNAGHDGLLAGENLYVGIKQLETAYQQNRGYDFEVTKNISLRQINPIALLQLRMTGACAFELPEVLFDMDFPGHYMRRIRSIGLSIPCIVGPYTGINATLRLTSNKFRLSAIAQDKNAYPETTDQEDDRFTTVNTPITAIAVSTGQNDTGVFELNFKDERYMPFEGAGAISTWTLSLPTTFKQFDYATISDVIIQMRYTSVDGGDKLQTVASGALTNYISSVEDLSQTEGLFAIFDVQHDFPNEWYKATQMPLPAGATARTLTLSNLADRLPVYTKGRKVTGVDVVLLTSAQLKASNLILTTDGNDNPFSMGVNIGSEYGFSIQDTEITINSWVLTINDTTTPLNDMWIAVRYTMK